MTTRRLRFVVPADLTGALLFAPTAPATGSSSADEFVDRHVSTFAAPGHAAVVRGPEGARILVRGRSSDGTPGTGHTRFRIASMSKAPTAAEGAHP